MSLQSTPESHIYANTAVKMLAGTAGCCGLREWAKSRTHRHLRPASANLSAFLPYQTIEREPSAHLPQDGKPPDTLA